MWALIIGRPGVLKSPAMEEALRPLKALSAKAEGASESEPQVRGGSERRKAACAGKLEEGGQTSATGSYCRHWLFD